MSIVKQLRDYGDADLHAYAKGGGVEVLTAPDPEDPERELPLVPDREALIEEVLRTLDLDELKELPEVKKHKRVRLDNKQDVIDAALGHATEQEREDAARAQAEAENDAAPSAEDVEKLNSPPVVEITHGSRPGLIEAVTVKKWVLGDDGTPVLAEMDDSDE